MPLYRHNHHPGVTNFITCLACADRAIYLAADQRYARRFSEPDGDRGARDNGYVFAEFSGTIYNPRVIDPAWEHPDDVFAHLDS